MTKIPDRLLTETVTIRRSVQTLAPATKRPVFHYETIATGVRARFNPDKSDLNRNVLGQTPKRGYQLFLNSRDIKANDEVVNETSGETFVVMEAKNLFGHHIEVVLSEKKS
jgi:hypothetical protein